MAPKIRVAPFGPMAGERGTMPSMPPAPKHTRRWFRFSLRTMFVVVTVFAIPCGWVALERRQSKRELQIVEQLKASNQTVEIEFIGRFDQGDSSSDANDPSWWRRALSALCGPRVGTLIATRCPSWTDILMLRELKSIEKLTIVRSQVSDLSPLGECTKLRWVLFDDAPVSDLATLAK